MLASTIVHPNVKRAMVTAAKGAGLAAIRALGKSRQKRANRNRYYVGKRVGIPPRARKGNRAPKQNVVNLGRTFVKTVAPNIGSFQTNFQTPGVRRETGQENLTALYIEPEHITNGFQLALSLPINPADPSIYAGLSAISNQYQRFRTEALAFRFIPSSATTQEGNVYMAFTPDPNMPDPSNVDDITRILGCQKGPLYGDSTVLHVSNQCLQQAYNVQTVDKTQLPGEETPLSVSGKLVIAFDGLPASVIAKTMGQLSATYRYCFSTPRLTQGSNSVTSEYVSTDAADSDHLDFSKLKSGIVPFVPYDLSQGIYKSRFPKVDAFLSFDILHTESPEPIRLAIEKSNDGASFSCVDVVQSDDQTRSVGHAVLPWARFYKFALVSAHEYAQIVMTTRFATTCR